MTTDHENLSTNKTNGYLSNTNTLFLTHNREYWNAVSSSSSSSANNIYQFGLWTLQSYTSF